MKKQFSAIRAAIVCSLAALGATLGSALAPVEVRARACESDNCNWQGAMCLGNPWNQTGCNQIDVATCETYACS